MTPLRDRLAEALDGHWLDRGVDGNGNTTYVVCTCGGWQWNEAPWDLQAGGQFPPFSEHIADALLASEPLSGLLRVAEAARAMVGWMEDPEPHSERQAFDSLKERLAVLRDALKEAEA